MTTSTKEFSGTGLRRTLVAAAIASAGVGAWAANPQFTIAPAAAGLTGGPALADEFILSNVSTVRVNGSTFTETGFLPVQSLLLNSMTALAPGLNTTYGLYFAFSGNGATPNPFVGTLNATYELYGYNGPGATFGFNGSNVPTINGSTTPIGTLLATGATTSPGTVLSFGGANLVDLNDLSFTRTTTLPGSLFFPVPVNFYTMAQATFSNGSGNATPFAGGVRINGGSGTFVFSPVPEPGTYAMMLAGLAAVGFAAKRRKS